MLNIIIPTYKARATLPDTLNSLVAQTKKLFITTIVQDCDGENYSDIIQEYTRRGLQIQLYSLPENVGPGCARQYGIDRSDQFDYLMFVDADDMLMPRAVEVLYAEAKKNNADVLASSIMREQQGGPGSVMHVNTTPVTWCFVAGTPILTKDGYRPIEELKVGDLVYTKNGTLKPIEAVMSHKADNMVSTRVSGALPLKCTDNHKFYTYNSKSELECIPIKDISYNTKLALFKLPKRSNSIDPNLAYIIGRYVGDGWKTSKKVQLKSGLKEYWSYFLCSSFDEKEEVISKLNAANIAFGFHNNDHVQEYTLHKSNKELIHYLEDCGRYATSKHFPREFLTWDDNTLKALLQGYFDADGCIIADRIDGTINKAITVSKQLALEISLILRTLGYNPTYGVKELDGTTQKIMGKICNRHNEYTVYWRDTNDKSKYVSNSDLGCSTYGLNLKYENDDIVYNITVADNHSYIAGDFIVSNCHGKIYKVNYLKEKDIFFPTNFRLNEDSFFNLVAVNSTDKFVRIEEITYIWRDNPNSLTRAVSEEEFFKKSWIKYIESQIFGLMEIMKRHPLVISLAAQTFINVYCHLELARHYKVGDYDKVLPVLRLLNHPTLQAICQEPDFWKYIYTNLRPGAVTKKGLVLYKKRFSDWLQQVKLWNGETKKNDIYC